MDSRKVIAIRLISWNVNGRRGPALNRQADALLAREPDLVALQEVTGETVARWQERLAAGGLGQLLDSAELLLVSAGAREYRRRYFNLIASRWPLEPLPGLAVVFPERYLAAQTQREDGSVELHVAHIPPGSTRGLIKIEMFEALFERLAIRPAHPRVLCGDFNTPREEHQDGTVRFWGETHPAQRERWNAAERSVILGLADHDLADVFQRLHRYQLPAASWVWRRGERSRSRRYDHVFASEMLAATACHYHTDWRERGLSDHAAIEADFAGSTRVVRTRQYARASAGSGDQ